MGHSVNLFEKLTVFSSIFVADTKIISSYNSIAPPSVDIRCFKVDFPNSCIGWPLEKEPKVKL